MPNKSFYVKKPIYRSKLRAKCGLIYYGLKRKLIWATMSNLFASHYDKPLAFLQYAHKTILLRQLKDVDMQYQYNKIINLKIAVLKLNGIVIKPGEIFSYWKLIGNPTRKKGYVDGMVLQNGSFLAGVGGGLCQMSNLIYWMTLHTPLTIIERHRHGYDVFPDYNRTQPFASGATCFYPHGDLMIRNDTNEPFQLVLRVGEKYLEGEWRALTIPLYTYHIIEKNHLIKGEYWGGFSRSNELHRQISSLEGKMITEEFIVSNTALMTYSPLLAKVENTKTI